LHFYQFNANKQIHGDLSLPNKMETRNLNGPLAIPFRVRLTSKDQATRSLVKSFNGLLQAVRVDPAMNGHDLTVALVLIRKVLDAMHNVVAMSHSEISRESGLSIGMVRRSLKKLNKSVYFHPIHPSQAELDAGGWTLRYIARLDLIRPATDRAAA
jgi:hypothetical protein